ncbi:MAG: carbohydrate kinase, partial [Oscillospiraceae bacterium]|nr:carbohydrate kinase [Oscillospiraceae bacterium]
AAILAGIGCGLYGSYQEAVEKTVTITKSYEPNEENRERYRHSMELYLELYRDLEKTFSAYT